MNGTIFVSSPSLKGVCYSICHRIIERKTFSNTFCEGKFLQNTALFDTGFTVVYLVRRHQFLSRWNTS